MLALFKERMELSKDVAAAKKEMNKAIYDAKRERDILDKVTRDAGPDLDLYARRFFEALFSLSRHISLNNYSKIMSSLLK